MASLTLTFVDAAALRAAFEQSLAKRRAFVPGAGGVAERSSCELVVEHAGRSFRIAAEVVYVKTEDPGRGVGLSIAPRDASEMAALRAFVEEAEAEPSPAEEPAAEAESADSDEEGQALHLYDRVRTASSVEQQRLAANGTLPERIALERLHGPNVWDTLLRNPRLTVPEIARMARKGTMPRPLLEMIAANASWLTAGEVQRALLSNPRSTSGVVLRVLQSMSRGDLARVPQQTAYPMTVRQAARKLLSP